MSKMSFWVITKDLTVLYLALFSLTSIVDVLMVPVGNTSVNWHCNKQQVVGIVGWVYSWMWFTGPVVKMLTTQGNSRLMFPEVCQQKVVTSFSNNNWIDHSVNPFMLFTLSPRYLMTTCTFSHYHFTKITVMACRQMPTVGLWK